MEILKQIKSRLAEAYGSRLKAVVLYGSEARGDSEPDSDIDVLVVLDGEIRLGEDVVKIIDVLYPLQLKVFRPIHALPVSAADYAAGEYALYRNAKRQGVPA
ncbi:MAG: nucleotidyltransferase domain-containing protein [Nitrospinae bacterium]|nr:nucleotidyltransferase domain-containing protein [Nitrospinota bacterium]